MGSFYEFVVTLKDFLHVGFLKFPLIITGTLFVLGLVTVNTAYLWVTMGAIVTAAAVWILQLIFNVILSKKPDWASVFTVLPNEFCSILTVGKQTGQVNVTPSYWYSLVIFFATYLFMNALKIYNRPPGSQSTAEPDTLNNRQFQASMCMGLIVLLTFILAYLRFNYASSCETILGFVLSLGAIGIGVGWFNMLSDCGEDRAYDLFGILGRIMPASTTAPQACVLANPEE